MGEKNKKNNEGEQKEGENKKKENGGGKNNVTVVLKADLHCQGCASKVIKCIRSFDGRFKNFASSIFLGFPAFEHIHDYGCGEVDPAKLREKLEQKTHKKVELISPQPKKDGDKKENGKGKENSGGDNAKQEKKKESKDKNSNDKSDEKKSKEKEPPVVTAVLKVNLHCDGCIQKIYKTVTKTKGYQDIKIDTQKDLVTVTGSMDMKALAELLQKQLKKDVEIVPRKRMGRRKRKAAATRARAAVTEARQVTAGVTTRWKETRCRRSQSGTRTHLCMGRVLSGISSTTTHMLPDHTSTTLPKCSAMRTPTLAVSCERSKM
ncbi:UNVERIFIED_CONTAM: Heavy metal-associated isoprenylated plant protein 3 [Sesamum calycinum]|uniref:Heavy metal-associated isoprenylated plant protein 3 n=1 Tax=Sesamum calycinum TaxID=2727403 RepID=A0AAW2SFR8_9LAMI